MIKAHQIYLQKIINLACFLKSDRRIFEAISHVRSSKQPVYQLLRDIVYDVRFYVVVENEVFWKKYAFVVIQNFIDSLTSEDWTNDKLRTGKKEDFLNLWLEKHILPLSLEQQRKIENEFGLNNSPKATDAKVVDDTDEGLEVENNITDETFINVKLSEHLPQEIKDYLNTYNKGNGCGLQSESHTAEAMYLSQLHPDLVELAKKIGRSGVTYTSNSNLKSKFQNTYKSDINGVTVGSDLNSLLPFELSVLASPSLENIFLSRFVQKRLQIFSAASSTVERGNNECGPIYMCIDTSESMSDIPEVTAKTLALAIAIIAQCEHRPVCIINYSVKISFFVLTEFRKQKRQLIAFLSKSYSGGNDENMLFRFLFCKLPQSAHYRKFTDSFKGADLLIISDFQWGDITPKNHQLICKAREKGMKLYALCIGTPYGDEFYLDCDYRYVYDNDCCSEFKENIDYETKTET